MTTLLAHVIMHAPRSALWPRRKGVASNTKEILIFSQATSRPLYFVASVSDFAVIPNKPFAVERFSVDNASKVHDAKKERVLVVDSPYRRSLINAQNKRQEVFELYAVMLTEVVKSN